jgi:hypothetical protein
MLPPQYENEAALQHIRNQTPPTSLPILNGAHYGEVRIPTLRGEGDQFSTWTSMGEEVRARDTTAASEAKDSQVSDGPAALSTPHEDYLTISREQLNTQSRSTPKLAKGVPDKVAAPSTHSLMTSIFIARQDPQTLAGRRARTRRKGHNTTTDRHV